MLTLPHFLHNRSGTKTVTARRRIALLMLTLCTLMACERDASKESGADVVVSIIPLKYFVERIAGDALSVSVMVGAGKSPEVYEPLPSQLVELNQATLFVSIGVPFEKVWLPKIKAQSPQLNFLDLDPQAHSMQMTSAEDDDHHEGHHHGHHMHHQQASHTWNDPVYALFMAELIHAELIALYPQHKVAFTKNFEVFLEEILSLDEELETLFEPYRDRGEFAVMHPAWEALADRYFLNEIAIEHDGKSPDARKLDNLTNELCWKNIQHIFIQPQFSPHLAETVAKSLEAELVEIDPLAEDYLSNIRSTAEKLRIAMDAALNDGEAED